MNPSLDELGREVAEALDEGPGREQLAKQRADFIAQASRDAKTSRGRLWIAWPVAGSLAAIVVILLLSFGADERAVGPTLTGHIGADQVAEGQFFRTEQEETLAVAFSEGSQVTVESRARVRLARFGNKAVDLSVEAGAVRSHIVPGKGVVWSFLAGPYRVRVLGTILRVDWQPSSERLLVEVSKGRVRVTGEELGDDGIAVASGQRLNASSSGVRLTRIEDEGEVDITVSEGSPSQSEAPEPAPESTEEALTQAMSEDRTAPSAAASHWRRLASAGNYGEAVAAAEREGFDQLVQKLPPAQLLELADAARLGGNLPRARQSLLVLRRRFAGQRHAHIAAFLLGRLAYDRSRNYREAAGWFETVLRENPNGPLSADARGRLMEAFVRLGRKEAALRAAREYLQLHPRGAYATAARSLIEQEETE